MSEPDKISNNAPFGSLASEAQERLRSGKVACWLVIVLMPAGITLDWFVYRDHVEFFMLLRLLCSVLAAGLLALHFKDWSPQGYRMLGVPVHRLLGLPIPLLPAFFIAWMIYVTQGIYSPYYAGLNLIVLAVSVVVRWDMRESILAVVGVALMYAVACAMHFFGAGLPFNDAAKTALYNNYYFLGLTGIIVVAGNYYFNKLRLELGRVRDQLAQAEKMASLGQMSAGVIHEINNPLNYATSGLFALSKQSRHIPEDRRADYEETVSDVQDGINRVSHIVSNLRIFTHPMFMRPDPTQLPEESASQIVEAALRNLAPLIHAPCRVINNVPAGLKVRGDQAKLQQVVENLIRNSLDAFAARPLNGEPPTITIDAPVLKTGTAISLRDNGPGIESRHLARIFDPFFTTKDVGKGMGLGLTVCQGIMQANGGKITVRSEVGKFTEFTLEFPS